MRKAVSFLLVILVLAALVSPAPLQALPRDASTPGAQSTSPSLFSYLEVFLLVYATDLAGIVAPFLPPAGIVEL